MEQSKQIARDSKSSFYYAFSLLSPEKRDAMNTVYAFCRKIDDIVDECGDPDDLKYEKLKRWRIEFEKAVYNKSDYALLNKLTNIIQQFNIPLEPFFELIIGMEMDLQKKRYLSFEDLKRYCYHVASTVGLMCIEIFGYKNKSTKDYAVNLGVAMQLTNILRDVGKDAENGRIYLPQNDLIKYNYTEDELLRREFNPNFVSVMRCQANRAHHYFNLANTSLDFEDKPSMFPARAMQHIYFKLLNKIESADYNVFDNNIKIGKMEKAAIALGVWAKYRLVY